MNRSFGTFVEQSENSATVISLFRKCLISETGFFSKLSDDVILNILYNLQDELGNCARIACVSTKFSSLIRTIYCIIKCSQAIPAIVSDLLPSGASIVGPPAGWASLYKLAVCCPDLVHSGVLLENSNFRIGSEIGPDEDYQENKLLQSTETTIICFSKLF
ncbi:UNVERIFIED_CONTAM: Phytochrome A-associated F-box protein [Sesamum radiatum]|uniref:Phytochrome A-associated F-box protein n=1 Tax=Sesamum radiatum TaxID=300843 RepID=A0AAW2W8Q8_SESRA